MRVLLKTPFIISGDLYLVFKGSQSTWQGKLVTGLYWVGWSLDQCLINITDHHNLLLPKPIARSNIPLLFITPSWNQTLIFEFGQKSKREPVYLQIEMIGKLVVLHIQETPEQGVVWSNRMHKNQSLEIWTRVLPKYYCMSNVCSLTCIHQRMLFDWLHSPLRVHGSIFPRLVLPGFEDLRENGPDPRATRVRLCSWLW